MVYYTIRETCTTGLEQLVLAKSKAAHRTDEVISESHMGHLKGSGYQKCDIVSSKITVD